MKVSNTFLQETKEDIRKLPPEIITFLLSDKGKDLNNSKIADKAKTADDLETMQAYGLRDLYSWTAGPKDRWQTDPSLIRRLERKKNLGLVKSKQLIYIFYYRNGDQAWFSPLDKKVYDWNHEFGLFNALTDRELMGAENLIHAYPYKKWLQLVSSEKKLDAFPR